MAKKRGVSDFGLPWILHVLLQIFVGPFWGALIRITRKRLLWGVIYFFTAGFFSIGWIYDAVCVILYGDYKLA